MNGTKSKEKDHIVYCALETYSLIGGLQNFNRRVIANLAARAKTLEEADVQILLLRDQTAMPPVLAYASIRASFNVHMSKFVLLPNAVDPCPDQAYAPGRSIEKTPQYFDCHAP